MLRAAYIPAPLPSPHAISPVLPPVPGVGSHSYTRIPAELLGPYQCPVPSAAAGQHPQATGVVEAEPQVAKMDVSVAYCTPEAAAWAAAHETAAPTDTARPFFSSPFKPAKFYPHGVPLEPVGDEDGIGARLLAEMHARLEQLHATDPALALNEPPKSDGPAGVRAIVLGRYIPQGEREDPLLAYGEMYKRPVGYTPGPPGFGYENYMRDPPPVAPEHTHFPDGPIGVPMSHGHPSFLGRTWRDAAPDLSKREPSAIVGGKRPPPKPSDGQSVLNLHSTLPEREYNARVVFRRFDTDGDGLLNLDDFVTAMNFLGAAITYDDATTIYELFDDDHSGTMDEDEFVQNFLNSYS